MNTQSILTGFARFCLHHPLSVAGITVIVLAGLPIILAPFVVWLDVFHKR